MNDMPKVLKWAIMLFIGYVMFQQFMQYPKRMEEARETALRTASAPQPEVTRVDTVVGSGPGVVCGQTVAIRYKGFMPDGRQFDSNATADKPLSFRVGERKVIKGWEQGVLGMKVGGTRRITVPAVLAYDDEEFTNTAVPKGHDVAFDIDLVSASPAVPESAVPLRVFDEAKGVGAPAGCGDELTLHYTVWSLDGKKLADTHGKDTAPVTFKPGSGHLWFGLERAAKGMSPAGKRTAIVPASFMVVWSPAEDAEKVDFPGKGTAFPADQPVIVDLDRVR